MSYRGNLKLEIFRDSATPEIDCEPAKAGLELLQKSFRTRELGSKIGIQVIRASRLIEVGNPDDDIIRTDDDMDWSKTSIDSTMDAHLNLILTGRSLGKNSDGMTMRGTAYRQRSALRRHFAFIDNTDENIVTKSTPHEVAHLLDAPNSGEYFDGEFHCNHPECLMQPVLELERTDFCDNCNSQLAIGAFTMWNDDRLVTLLGRRLRSSSFGRIWTR